VFTRDRGTGRGLEKERRLIKGRESNGDGYKTAPCSRLNLLRLDRIGFQTGS
jgi:hypothetical protein